MSKRWRWVIAWWIGIMVTAALGRSITDVLRARGWLGTSVTVALAVAAVATMALAMRRIPGGWRQARLWLVGAGLLGIALGARVLEQPEERLHLIQFGVFGALLLAAAGNGTKGTVQALVVGAFGGWGDELWQSCLPHRVYDVWDILLNVVAVFSGVLLAHLATGGAPQGDPTAPDTPSR